MTRLMCFESKDLASPEIFFARSSASVQRGEDVIMVTSCRFRTSALTSSPCWLSGPFPVDECLRSKSAQSWLCCSSICLTCALEASICKVTYPRLGSRQGLDGWRRHGELCDLHPVAGEASALLRTCDCRKKLLGHERAEQKPLDKFGGLGTSTFSFIFFTPW